MNLPTHHKTGAATKYIIDVMTKVHGKDNVPSQNTVYRWIPNFNGGLTAPEVLFGLGSCGTY